MPQYRKCDTFDVLKRDIQAVFHKRACPGCADQCLCRTRACPLPDIRIVCMSCHNQIQNIIHNGIRNRNLCNACARCKQAFPVHDLCDLWRMVSLRQFHDFPQFLPVRKFYQHFKQKTVQLGFRQRISSLVFDRILCGKHQKRLRQLMAGRSDRHGVFLHGL